MFHSRNTEEIGDEEVETFPISLHDLEEIFRHGAVVQGPVQEGLHRAGNHSQGGAKFMGDIGDKFLSNGFEISNFGHIVEYDHRSWNSSSGPRLQWRGMDCQMLGGEVAFSSWDFSGQFDMVRVPVGEGFGDDILEFVLTKNLHHRALDGGLHDGEHAVQGLIDEADPQGVIGDQNSLDHAGENGAKIKVLVGDLTVLLAELLGDLADVDRGVMKEAALGIQEHGAKVSVGQAVQSFPELTGWPDDSSVYD